MGEFRCVLLGVMLGESDRRTMKHVHGIPLRAACLYNPLHVNIITRTSNRMASEFMQIL